jgi:hypothetical protein
MQQRGGSARPVSGTVSEQPGTCAWPTRADPATLNVGYPDTGATYWATRHRLVPGEHLEITGAYPAARYFSFATYRTTGEVRDSVPDRDVAAIEGANPYAGASEGRPGRGRYVVRVVRRSSDEADGLVGGANGAVVHRVYLPESARDRAGGVPLPTLRAVGTGGAVRTLRPCAKSSASPDAVEMVDRNGPPTDRSAPARPTFVRPGGDANRLFTDVDNVYLATIVRYAPGRLVVVQGRAPSFPDTGSGARITGKEQVRYWTVCTYEYRTPYPVTACVADESVALDADGNVTVVVSTKAERPANATRAEGVTWLDWGSTKVDGAILVRNRVPAPGFTKSSLDVPAGAPAASTMGRYAPVGRYCAATDFARGGAAACRGG